MAKATKGRKAALDKFIEQLYYKHSVGRQINIMDISKVFEAGHAAYESGTIEAVELAVIGAVQQYTQVSA